MTDKESASASASAAGPEPSLDDLIARVVAEPGLERELTDAQVEAVVARANPFAARPGPGLPSEAEDARAFVSVVNMEGEYQRKLLTTALVGYVYQALKEHEVAADLRRYTPRHKDKDPAEPATTDSLLAAARGAVAQLEEVKAMEVRAAELEHRLAEVQLDAAGREARRPRGERVGDRAEHSADATPGPEKPKQDTPTEAPAAVTPAPAPASAPASAPTP